MRSPKGEGKVIPSSQLQIVQSVDGVVEIRVREGQIRTQETYCCVSIHPFCIFVA